MSIFKVLFAEVDESTNDKLGAYPEKVHVSAMPERRYLKTSRTMTIVGCFFLCSALILAVVVYMLAPLPRSEPLLLSIDKRFYRLVPVQRSVVIEPANTLVMEEHIKQYILLRNAILPDLDEMSRRWDLETSLLKWFSADKVFANFLLEREVNLARMMEGLTREVVVRFVVRVDAGLWLAEYDTIEYLPEDEFPTVKRWRAVLEAGFLKKGYPSRDERIKNPLDFHVSEYNIASRALTKDDENAKFID